MSNQNLSWKELQFLYQLTGKPISMGKLPAGYCHIYDNDQWELHGMPQNSDAILVTLDRMDQRTTSVAGLPPSVQSLWYNHPDVIEYGENATGAYRIFKDGFIGAIIPEPTTSELKQIVENFGPFTIDTDYLGNLKIVLNR